MKKLCLGADLWYGWEETSYGNPNFACGPIICMHTVGNNCLDLEKVGKTKPAGPSASLSHSLGRWSPHRLGGICFVIVSITDHTYDLFTSSGGKLFVSIFYPVIFSAANMPQKISTFSAANICKDNRNAMIQGQWLSMVFFHLVYFAKWICAIPYWVHCKGKEGEW